MWYLSRSNFGLKLSFGLHSKARESLDDRLHSPPGATPCADREEIKSKVRTSAPCNRHKVRIEGSVLQEGVISTVCKHHSD